MGILILMKPSDMDLQCFQKRIHLGLDRGLNLNNSIMLLL